ncbi:MAG TPA: ATP synthase F0 subunit C [Pirellulaceae bacterium]|nr:ATP synthase F0 subunit C [Pirellulaceae bacterium]
MSKWLVLCLFVVLSALATPVMAQTGGEGAAAASGPSVPGMALVGAGLVILGVGIGIGRIGDSACQSTARQPEMAGRVFTTMIISAALIEGAAFFALLLVLMKA